MTPVRSLAPDLARGFMLLGIAIANVPVYLWGREFFLGQTHPVDGSGLDRALSVFAMLTIEQRVYPMFAFLFGYGIMQFASARAGAGVPEQVARRMLTRRHLWLIVFGAVHAALLFTGDILGAYGLAGLIITALFFTARDRAIKITVWVFIGLAALGAVALGLAGTLLSVLDPSLTGVGADAADAELELFNGESNYLLSLLMRLVIWLFATPAAVMQLLIPAAMLLGMLAGRHRWLDQASTRPKLGLVAVIGIGVGVIGALPTALIYLGFMPGFENASWVFLGLTSITGFAAGIGYAALFGFVGARVLARAQRHSPPFGPLRLPSVWRAVAAVGQRSLSFYLLQSLIFAPVLSGWGWGLGATISMTGAYTLAVSVWLFSVAIAAVLDRRGIRGPAEVLLRSLTYRAALPPRTAVTAAPAAAVSAPARAD
ncbi:putative membrane protein YeiB [Leucobacter exalbidus]|uniref:Membrane protein YeiB n=1 Tax=Leucobacter exalbidus TaxID=662960 RepID=A0A940PXB2_9MICO|nr:DUF418 domain-containing protein [Leucobacter exalbidus]MBP1325886.1 putative membrane protein YeiB [Leucobacter exalbidus]